MTFGALRPSSRAAIVGVLAVFSVGPVFVVATPPFFNDLDFYGRTALDAEYDIVRPHVDEWRKGIVLRHADGSTSRATHEDLNIPFWFTPGRGGYGKLYQSFGRRCRDDAGALLAAIDRTLGLEGRRRVTSMEVTHRHFRKESLGGGRSRTVLVEDRVPITCP